MGCNLPLTMIINPTNLVGVSPPIPLRDCNGQNDPKLCQLVKLHDLVELAWREAKLQVELACCETKLQTSSRANMVAELACCEAKL